METARTLIVETGKQTIRVALREALDVYEIRAKFSVPGRFAPIVYLVPTNRTAIVSFN